MSALRSRGHRASTPDPGQLTDGESVPPLGTDVSRRTFLKGSSLTVAAAGLLSVVPGLPTLISEIAPDSSGAEAAATDTSEVEAGTLAEPLVLHVKDLQSGEMSLYVGEREIPYRDPALASRILRASR